MPQKEKSTTLHDVAEHAGVSPMTVSRVINGETKVRDATKARVLKSIETLNYKPNLSARALAGNRAYKVALLYGNPSASYLSELLVGALEEISRHGHQLLVHKVSEKASEKKVRESLTALVGEYDGVIVPPPLSDHASVRAFLSKADIPAVFLSGRDGGGRSCKICIDDYEAARDITSYLIELGHRRIGFIKGNANQFSTGERLRGYKAALAEGGISYDKALVAAGLFTYASGLKAAGKLLSTDLPPTGIFASNDDMAAATLAVAASKGLAVPDDLSVVGFDDSPLASTVFPRLTTVKQPLAEMAAEAVKSLAGLIGAVAGGKAARAEPAFMTYSIVHGASTGAPPPQA